MKATTLLMLLRRTVGCGNLKPPTSSAHRRTLSSYPWRWRENFAETPGCSSVACLRVPPRLKDELTAHSSFLPRLSLLSLRQVGALCSPVLPLARWRVGGRMAFRRTLVCLHDVDAAARCVPAPRAALRWAPGAHSSFLPRLSLLSLPRPPALMGGNGPF